MIRNFLQKLRDHGERKTLLWRNLILSTLPDFCCCRKKMPKIYNTTSICLAQKIRVPRIVDLLLTPGNCFLCVPFIELPCVTVVNFLLFFCRKYTCKKGLMFCLVKQSDRHQTEYQTVADSIFQSGNNFYLQICSLPIADSSAAVQLLLGEWLY